MKEKKDRLMSKEMRKRYKEKSEREKRQINVKKWERDIWKEVKEKKDRLMSKEMRKRYMERSEREKVVKWDQKEQSEKEGQEKTSSREAK